MILLDEPFAALDAQTRELMQIEPLRVWDTTKKTAIFITQISEVVYLADRVVVMSARPGARQGDRAIDIPRPPSGLGPARSACSRSRTTPRLIESGAERNQHDAGRIERRVADDAQLVTHFEPARPGLLPQETRA